ncbi:glycosyltransferase family 2 protein [Phocaeicola plebeius]|jgi:glycosyltransferase involved in cell wall biosynthesis|uniref:Glycosyltransferase family 2 protein n=1 Tax=Phocaeicola plebeius TaxID=310297 RepID=A0A415SS52_9BACT|nr:glycosyltransferase family 2 protein [Phocaeicola plebeius]MBS4810953.1 glycosyltransferase family 2 protein [Bacteroides sp.]MBS4825873.1 glycosyltransferase family 2 protein [Bacteroides sp.]RHA26824.1 glycosyltransferase family 2 protein [Phocaeicola plebeius]RHA29284.1 glycosyltransferase family 2 protein [Phocaeicola plebeius]RHM91691.1 glycosyltransferase family 2 protein [Phocaeicola plebeius]
MSYKVSVIIPIYGVEKFIGRCAKTLMQQTLKEVEYIFVNDATPDCSMKVLQEVLARYPERQNSVVVAVHETNKGLPAARNTGLQMAQGEYIFHCDSDDFVEPDMLETLYTEAVMHRADIVWCDWFLSFEKNERYMKQPSFDTALEALKTMLSGGMKYNVWNKLVRRSLYADYQVSFPAGYGMGEDMTMLLLFAHAGRVAYVPKAFYHYVKLNTGAMSNVYSDRHKEELKYNVNRTAECLTKTYGNTLEKEIAFLKLEAKFPFLLMGDTRLYRLWKEWYPEANRYILQNRGISARSRWLQWCAWKNLFGLVWIYNQLFHWAYKILYR